MATRTPRLEDLTASSSETETESQIDTITISERQAFLQQEGRTLARTTKHSRAAFPSWERRVGVHRVYSMLFVFLLL